MVFEDVEVHAGPSSCHDIQQDSPLPRDDKGDSPYEDEDDIEFGLGLDDLLPAPESPLPPPYSYATYACEDLNLVDGRKSIITRLVGSHPLWGHHLWNTSRVLSDYLRRNPAYARDLTVLELGAGAGLPSLVCSVLGARRVMITDYPDVELVENIRWNVETNLPLTMRRNVNVEGFVWGADVHGLISNDPATSDQTEGSEGYDLIILSDLVFNHSQHPALISSVNSLLSRKTTSSATLTPCLLVFFTHHRPHLVAEDMAFLTNLADSGDGWAYERVVEEFAGAMFDEDPGDEKVRGTVKGYRAWRIPPDEAKQERQPSSHS